jgi:hypothetical protein
LTTSYDFKTIVPKFDAILSRGLCSGVGKREGQMCIEAAICAVLDLPHGDDPKCVTPAIRSYKIALNDKRWSSTQARAEGLRDLGIAQIGSRGVVDGVEFAKRLAEGTIRILLPTMIRETKRLAADAELMRLADVCEKEGSLGWARALRARLYAAYAAADAAAYAAADAAAYAAADAAAYAAAYAAADAAAYAAADAAAYAAAYAAADAAAHAADAADAASDADARRDRFLRLSASIALQILIDLKSPGAEWIEPNAVNVLAGQ